jgi:hypothetical protein
MPAPALEEDARTRRGRWKMLLVLAVCAAPVIASYFTYFVIRPTGRTNHGDLIEPLRELPATLPLRALDGTPVAPASLTGQWLLMVVAGSACPQACEQHLYLQRQLRQTLGRDSDRLDKVWLIPDDGPVRAELQSAVLASPAVNVLRTDPAALSAWLRSREGHGLDEAYFLVDPMGRWMMRWPADTEPSLIKRDLERLLRASASWDRAGR